MICFDTECRFYNMFECGLKLPKFSEQECVSKILVTDPLWEMIDNVCAGILEYDNEKEKEDK